MKIAIIVKEFPALSETFILDQIVGLIDRGNEVDIFASRPRNNFIIHPNIEKYNLLNHTLYFNYGNDAYTIPTNKFLRLLKALRLITTNFQKYPVVVLKSLNFIKYGKRAANLVLLYKTIIFLNKNNYDIIHCNFGENGITGALLKDIGAIKGKIITTFHGFDISKSLKNEGRSIYDDLFKKGDLFLPVSEKWKNELIKLGCSKKKIVVHRMGVDMNKFIFTPNKHKKGNKIHLLSVCRLIEKKGINYSIQAVAKVLKKYPEIKYKIVGDGPLRNDLEALINERNVNNNIKILGYRQQEEIVKLMSSSDLFLAPSITTEDGDQEGIPVTIMEALAQGLIVLSTKHSGIPELIKDGETGILVPERDIDALAKKIQYYIEHPEMWTEMGRAGRKNVEEHYDINKLNDQLVEVYQKLLNVHIQQIPLNN
jgi:colanic acid/amylovoran biosynthesis glycosyltransferase